MAWLGCSRWTGGGLARRRSAGLTALQQELLTIWGYPFVMEQFRFHVTLTSKLDSAEADATLPAAQEWFGQLLRPRSGSMS